MNKKEIGIVLDSQCLSYLIDATVNFDEPTGDLAEEKKALIRIWFYQPETFWVTETVVSECANISNTKRRKLHESFIKPLFVDLPIRDKSLVRKRAVAYMLFHPKENDCGILAEAVDQGAKVVLSYDGDFLKRLASVESLVSLLKPSEYWARLDIQPGSSPINVPHESNPLSTKGWWKW